MSKTKIKLVQSNVSSEILKAEEVKEYCEKVVITLPSKIMKKNQTTFSIKYLQGMPD